MLLELVRGDPVGACALLAPRGVPDPRALEHGVRVDGVDTDAVGAELLCQAAREVERRRLRSGVRGRVLPRSEGILRPDEDDAPAHALGAQDTCRLACDQEVAAGEDVVVAIPELEARLFDRRARRDAGV